MAAYLCRLLFAAVFVVVIASCVGPKHFTRKDVDLRDIKRVAVMPFENFTSDEFAGEKIRRLVISGLLVRVIDVVEPGEVTASMRELGVTSPGGISTKDIRRLSDKMKVQAIMVGAVESYELVRGVRLAYPVVTVHLLLLDGASGDILWSVWHTSGGPSFWNKHFGTEADAVSDSARHVVEEAVSMLF